MGNLPKQLRERLASDTDLQLLTPIAGQDSTTGQTRKVLFRLLDGNAIESVLMSYDERRTACISTQVGCGIGCIFCATGQGGLARNLSGVEETDTLSRSSRRSAGEASAVRAGLSHGFSRSTHVCRLTPSTRASRSP